MGVYVIDNKTLNVTHEGQLIGNLVDLPEMYESIYKIAPPEEMDTDEDAVDVTFRGFMKCSMCGTKDQLCFTADNYTDWVATLCKKDGFIWQKSQYSVIKLSLIHI